MAPRVRPPGGAQRNPGLYSFAFGNKAPGGAQRNPGAAAEGFMKLSIFSLNLHGYHPMGEPRRFIEDRDGRIRRAGYYPMGEGLHFFTTEELDRGHRRRLDRLGSDLALLGPDVICLQEVAAGCPWTARLRDLSSHLCRRLVRGQQRLAAGQSAQCRTAGRSAVETSPGLSRQRWLADRAGSVLPGAHRRLHRQPEARHPRLRRQSLSRRAAGRGLCRAGPATLGNRRSAGVEPDDQHPGTQGVHPGGDDPARFRFIVSR